MYEEDEKQVMIHMIKDVVFAIMAASATSLLMVIDDW